MGAAAGGERGAAPGLHRPLLTPISPLRLKISHLDSIFLSRLAWANVGGLPGERGGGRAPRGQPGAGSKLPSQRWLLCWLPGGGCVGAFCGGGEWRNAVRAGAWHVDALQCFQLQSGLCGACEHVCKRRWLPGMRGFAFLQLPEQKG